MQSLGSFNYWIVIIPMMLGFYAVLARSNLIKKVVGPERVVAGGPPYGDIDCCADVGSEPAEPKTTNQRVRTRRDRHADALDA